MAQFQDSGGREWLVLFDAFVLSDIRKEADIDLADISAGGWLKIETDSAALGQVAAILCRSEIKQRNMTPREFIRLLRGKTIEAVRKALTDEGADFFPQNEWSAIQANCSTRKEATSQTMQMAIAMDVVKALGPEGKQWALQMMQEGADSVKGNANSAPSKASRSASGPVDIRSKNVTPEPESAELTAVG